MNHLKSFELTLNETKVIKGVAILLMLIHHFFSFPDWINSGNEFIGIPFLESTIEFYIGTFGKMCVTIFLFLTGYGLFYSYQKKNAYLYSLKKLGVFLINYWLILCLIFIPLQLLNSSFEFSLKSFILNLVGLRSDYIMFAWYVHLQIAIIILFPLLKRLIKTNLIQSIVYGICIPVMLRIVVTTLMNRVSILSGNTFLILFNEFLVYLPFLLSGYIFSKFKLFSKMNHYLPIFLDKWYVYVILIIGTMIGRNLLPMLSELIYVPTFIFSVISLIRMIHHQWLTNGLAVLGEHSLNLWFLHAMFFGKTAYLQWIAYYPKISVLIILWVLILLIPVSVLINKIMKKIRVYMFNLSFNQRFKNSNSLRYRKEN
ncbi:MAG: hypothetical protein Q3980_04965 [Turicibacter sp.]|nr:hypothetical protein [Turicibacter sp.]